MHKAFIAIAVILLSLSSMGIAVNAAEFATNDDVMKMQMNGMVKRAKALGSGNGIGFTLPELGSTDSSNYIIDAIELAVFEKRQNDAAWQIYKDANDTESKKKLIENPASLNISLDFGNVSDYRIGARYKVAYRYYVRVIDDLSKFEIAGQEIKDGWRMVGEANPAAATDNGFSFYVNTAPAIAVNSISFNVQTGLNIDTNGIRNITYTPVQMQSMFLPSNALVNGTNISITAGDADNEDILSVGYRLIDKSSNHVIADKILESGLLPNSTKSYTITENTDAANLELVMYTTDNWTARSEATPVKLSLDKTPPYLVSEFQSFGRAIKGRNLYSKFVLCDDNNVSLSSGEVYYALKKKNTNGQYEVLSGYDTVRIPSDADGNYIVDLFNLDDGEYEIYLNILDKAYNRITHSLYLTMDNTPPSIRYVPENEDSRATLYNTWVNYTENIVIDVADTYSNIKKTSCLQGSTTIYNSTEPGRKVIPIPDLTGKISFNLMAEDSACTLDKALNSVDLSSAGNSTNSTNSVWIDKTPPYVEINAHENTWYSPTTIYANIADFESTIGAGDNSGVKSTEYCITDSPTPSTSWQPYTGSGVRFDSGGVYYLHIKAVDFAGNETIKSKKININSPSSIIGMVKPTVDYMHTIYHSVNDLYVVKNTAYNTKYTFAVQDFDTQDTVRTNIWLVNADDNSIRAESSIDTVPTGSAVRYAIFNMAYLKADNTPLPDGVYTMYVDLYEVKNDGSVIASADFQNYKGCEVVIKRSAPPKPEITISDTAVGKKAVILYPDESLANSLNQTYIKALYKREYKQIFDENMDSNTYVSYTAPIEPITKDCNVTALYIDCAGNISTASIRVYANGSDGSPEDSSITEPGNSVTVEEDRPSTVYYIGTRRPKEAALKSNVFQFIK